MQDIWSHIWENIQWIFSGVGVVVLLPTARVVGNIVQLLNNSAIDSFVGKWNCYRLARSDGRIIKVFLSINKSFTRGIYCTFRSDEIKQSSKERLGSVTINEATVSCYFPPTNLAKAPGLFVFPRNESPQTSDMHIGASCGTLATNGAAFTAKVILSKRELMPIDESLLRGILCNRIMQITVDNAQTELFAYLQEKELL